MSYSDKYTIVLSVFVGLFMVGMFSLPFFVVNKYQAKHKIVHTYDTIIDSGIEYIIQDSISALLNSLKTKAPNKLEVPDSVLFNGMLVPVEWIHNCAFMEIFYDEGFLDDVVAYKSNVGIPFNFECRNVKYVISKDGYDWCMFPSFCDFRNLNVLKLYGDGIFSYGDGDNDKCEKFVQGCENLETVVLSGFESVCIFDGFNYCINLKTLVLEDIGRIYIEDGFRATNKLSYICIKGDTIGKDITITGIDKKIIYKR